MSLVVVSSTVLVVNDDFDESSCVKTGGDDVRKVDAFSISGCALTLLDVICAVLDRKGGLLSGSVVDFRVWVGTTKDLDVWYFVL